MYKNGTWKSEWLERDRWLGYEVVGLLSSYDDWDREALTNLKSAFYSRHPSAREEVISIYRYLSEAVIAQKLSFDDSYSNHKEAFYHYIPREVITWACEKKALFPYFPFTLEDLKDCVDHEPPEKEAGAVGAGDTQRARYPWGDYTTKNIELLAQAVKEFWTTYDPEDPTTAPTNEQVEKWLVTQGMVKRTAEEVAKILRADGLPYIRRK